MSTAKVTPLGFLSMGTVILAMFTVCVWFVTSSPSARESFSRQPEGSIEPLEIPLAERRRRDVGHIYLQSNYLKTTKLRDEAGVEHWYLHSGSELSQQVFQKCGEKQTSVVLIPTVPRSGNTLLRSLIESRTGVMTADVYMFNPEGDHNKTIPLDLSWFPGLKERPFLQPHGMSKWLVLLGRASTAQPDVVLRQPNESDVLFLKTHYPYHGPEFSPETCLSGIVMTSRNPLDNYIGWLKYSRNPAVTRFRLGKDGVMGPDPDDIANYVDIWAGHHTFWRNYAAARGIPFLQLRYEDMCANMGFAMDTLFNRFLAQFNVPLKPPQFTFKQKQHCVFEIEAAMKLWWIKLPEDKIRNMLNDYPAALEMMGYDALIRQGLEKGRFHV